jgi:hypothetical protein
LYCGPHSEGTFTLNQLRDVFAEIAKISSIHSVYFEGGEPFLYYPLMVEGIKIAREMNLKTGIVSNGYWATGVEDAELWLKPISELKISELSLSDDTFHYGDIKETPSQMALKAAQRLEMPAGSICIEEPTVKTAEDAEHGKGEPVVGGGAMFKGRAVDKLTEGLPRKHWERFTTCPHEELIDPGRVHVDSYGHVHICQGLSMGNMWETPLSELVSKYDPHSHPICGPLIKGGPAALAREYDVEHEDTYVDECHMCYVVRKALIDRFPEYLAPRQVYGIE